MGPKSILSDNGLPRHHMRSQVVPLLISLFSTDYKSTSSRPVMPRLANFLSHASDVSFERTARPSTMLSDISLTTERSPAIRPDLEITAHL